MICATAGPRAASRTGLPFGGSARHSAQIPPDVIAERSGVPWTPAAEISIRPVTLLQGGSELNRSSASIRRTGCCRPEPASGSGKELARAGSTLPTTSAVQFQGPGLGDLSPGLRRSGADMERAGLGHQPIVGLLVKVKGHTLADPAGNAHELVIPSHHPLFTFGLATVTRQQPDLVPQASRIARPSNLRGKARQCSPDHLSHVRHEQIGTHSIEIEFSLAFHTQIQARVRPLDQPGAEEACSNLRKAELVNLGHARHRAVINLMVPAQKRAVDATCGELEQPLELLAVTRLLPQKHAHGLKRQRKYIGLAALRGARLRGRSDELALDSQRTPEGRLGPARE